MSNKLIILGAGGHGKVIADIALKMNRWNSISFLDDDGSIKTAMGIEVVGKLGDYIKYVDENEIIVGIGNNAIRKKIQGTLESVGVRMPVLIHPSAVIGKSVEIGTGTIVMANATINCCTYLGKGCIVNTGATIDHDNYIEDYVHISPGVHLAGAVKVGNLSWLGIGSIVSNNIIITERCTIGAGAVVVKDITESGTYVGVPAKNVHPC